MRIVDINLLLYAINRDAPNHKPARQWWESALSSAEPVGLAWLVVLGFVRIATHPRILPRPLSSQEALSLMESWLELPATRIVEPTARHWPIFRDLLGAAGTAANLTSDAHLAAIAIEHGATLYSTDRDFGRFSQLRWRNPLPQTT